MKETCSITDCVKPLQAKGLCGMHYARMKRRGTTTDPPPPFAKCVINDCQQSNYGNGLCRMHWMRNRRHGSPDVVLPRGGTPERMTAMRQAMKPARIPDCHPDRKHRAHGLCGSCYSLKYHRDFPESNTAATWLRNHPEAARLHKRKALLKRNGLTLDQYDSMWAVQAGKCANPRCLTEAPLVVPDFRRGLQVDHDHATGAIRGLLCARCNTALGHINDDKNRLLGLIEYLELSSA